MVESEQVQDQSILHTENESRVIEAGGSLRVTGLTVSANTSQGKVTLVNGVDLTLRAGRMHGVAGESGSGKTVTGLALMGLLDRQALNIESGQVMLGSEDLLHLSENQMQKKRGAEISMVFQEPMTSFDPMFTIGYSISRVLRTHLSLNRVERKRRAIELLDRVGIPRAAEKYDAYPFELSGGLLQRALIAMAISCEPKILIADEPTTALDVTVQAQVMNLLRELSSEGLAVLLITHDIGVISEYTDDLTVMYAGQVIEFGETDALLADPKHPYTSALIQAVPSTRVRLERLPTIPGRVPMSHEMPLGCHFAPRCAHARDVCEEPVELVTLADRNVRCVRWEEISWLTK